MSLAKLRLSDEGQRILLDENQPVHPKLQRRPNRKRDTIPILEDVFKQARQEEVRRQLRPPRNVSRKMTTDRTQSGRKVQRRMLYRKKPSTHKDDHRSHKNQKTGTDRNEKKDDHRLQMSRKKTAGSHQQKSKNVRHQECTDEKPEEVYDHRSQTHT